MRALFGSSRLLLASSVGIVSACTGSDAGVDRSGLRVEGGAAQPPPPSAADPSACPSYETDFRPLVHDRVCSACHGVDRDIPDWAAYTTASASCSTIRDVVGSGQMPPGDSPASLSAAERELVLRWADLGCPETAAQAATACAAAGPSSPDASGGGATGITVASATWDPDDGELRIEGDVSNPNAALTAQFLGRSEPLANDGGSFEGRWEGVTPNPGTVRVEADDGSFATVAVQED